MPDIVEVIVFAADADTLLTVYDSPVAGHLTLRIHRPQEQWLKLKIPLQWVMQTWVNQLLQFNKLKLIQSFKGIKL